MFPLSSKKSYNHSLYFAQSLATVLPLKKGQRVLELGCGTAIASMFLARKYDVEIYAIDRWADPTETHRVTIKKKLHHNIIPLKSDVRALPFPREYFDVIFSVNSHFYYGTDERYIPYIVQFLKPKGKIGVIDTCVKNEINNLSEIPEPLRKSIQNHWYYIHSIGWWENHWKKTGLVSIKCIETLPESKQIINKISNDLKNLRSDRQVIDYIKRDEEKFVNFFRIVGQRTANDVHLEYVESLI
jgi:cyclopropane fatty-acyl-phospholipid synthase-like methyltransferase